MYEKVVPKTPNQLMVDPSEKTLRFQIDTDKYEANPEYYNGKVELDEKGRVKLWPLDPRDCIFEAIQGDDYAEQPLS